MMNSIDGKMLRRKGASQYLKDRWSIERAPSTLAKLATVGGGPRFVLVGRIPLYPEPELDAWAQSITSPLLSSTSDRNKDKAGNAPAPLQQQTAVVMDHHPESATEDHGGTCPSPRERSSEPATQATTRPALTNLLRYQEEKYGRKARG